MHDDSCVCCDSNAINESREEDAKKGGEKEVTRADTQLLSRVKPQRRRREGGRKGVNLVYFLETAFFPAAFFEGLFFVEAFFDFGEALATGLFFDFGDFFDAFGEAFFDAAGDFFLDEVFLAAGLFLDEVFLADPFLDGVDFLVFGDAFAFGEGEAFGDFLVVFFLRLATLFFGEALLFGDFLLDFGDFLAAGEDAEALEARRKVLE